jgi:hypothetical protein
MFVHVRRAKDLSAQPRNTRWSRVRLSMTHAGVRAQRKRNKSWRQEHNVSRRRDYGASIQNVTRNPSCS